MFWANYHKNESLNPLRVTNWHPQRDRVALILIFFYLIIMESLGNLMSWGKELGLTGEELQAFVVKQQKIKIEERQLRRETEKQVAEAEKEKALLAIELEKKRIRHEQAQEVRAHERFINEAAERQKEREHELKKLELKGKPQELTNEDEDKFEWTKVSKLLPKFNEKDLPKFFLHFEKLMNQCECPEKFWTLLLQSVLTGKAQVAYSCMDVEVSKDYDLVKGEILKLYQLVPKAYRLKFRDFHKESNSTYVEFARNKRLKFREWYDSQKVSTFEELEELMLLEDFKNNLSHNLKVHIEELQITKLDKAAEVSDEYTLIHKVSGKVSNSDQNYKKSFHKQGEKNNAQRPKGRCYNCNSLGHYKSQCPMNKPKPTLLIDRAY